jgi:hypothetical protein
MSDDGSSGREGAPGPEGTDWIDTLSDEQCMEIFWLYVDPPEEFLRSHPPELLGRAMRYALRLVAGEVARDARGSG